MASRLGLPATLSTVLLALFLLSPGLADAIISFPHKSDSLGNYPRNAACRFLPGDAEWPNDATWSRLNKTVGGRLIDTVPVASEERPILYYW